MCYHSGPEWTREQWQWRSTPHSLKLQHHWNLSIRLFSVIYTRWKEVLPFWRGAVGVFYKPRRLSHRAFIFWDGSYPSAEIQSVYSTAPADWASGHSLGEVFLLCRDTVGVFNNLSRPGRRALIGRGLTLLQRCSRCILQPQPSGPQETRWEGVIPLCRSAVGVYFSPLPQPIGQSVYKRFKILH